MAKYKVDDWVWLVGSTTREKAHILEILEQTCEAKIIQAKYLVRLLIFDSYQPGRGTNPAFHISEMEIKRKLTKEELEKTDF